MTDMDVRKRLSQGEDSSTQFKSEPIGVSKLAAKFTAFTNSNGGIWAQKKDNKAPNSNIESANSDKERSKSELTGLLSGLRSDRARAIVRVMDLIRADGSVRISEIMKDLSASRSAVNSYIEFLKNHGVLVREGGRFGGSWRIVHE